MKKAVTLLGLFLLCWGAGTAAGVGMYYALIAVGASDNLALMLDFLVAFIVGTGMSMAILVPRLFDL